RASPVGSRLHSPPPQRVSARRRGRGAARAGRPVVERDGPHRGADGRHLLSRASAGRGTVCRGRPAGRARTDALHPRSDEVDERGQGRRRGDRPRNPRRECATGRIRAAAVRARACGSAAAGRPVAMFTRVLVANRGEIAVRVIRALHELGVEAVAVYSTADAGALHTRIADRAVCIGPPSATESYLNIASVIAAGETTGCEAVHPGYGFLSENPDFVHACEDNDLVFVGPDADVMARMGDKVEAKRELAAAGVPLVPGTEVVGPGEARSAAANLGYPVFLKAAAGGGGKGMRVVERAEDFDEAFARAAAEAEAAFGDGNLSLAKLVVPARHVEIQVLCDADGGVLTLGERECSIQRRHQKLIEESPSPALDEATREAMEADVARAARAIGYLNAGTFEFLLAPDGSYYFIELNARLQVEHPVTELVTGVDLVREQLRIAAGQQLERTGR